ncbi:MAG: gamma-glutamyltransferase [Cyclobacteriaceae bacterium]|nr:gamma-glutamyltransferase [Cyclobacteriaceae bacterium]
MKHVYPLLVLLLLSLNACQTAEKQTAPLKGFVSAAHPLATQAGLEVLAKGGNAFDAFIAVASTLNVTEPMMSGIGGYGTILIYDAKKSQVRYLNSSGRIPVGTNSDLMRAPTPNFMENRTGAKAVSTPSNLHAWEAMHKEYGSLEWTSLFDRAIEHAENGFEVYPLLARFIEMSAPDFTDYTKGFYAPSGMPLGEGDQLVQKDLATTFKQIANAGVASFYEGSIADAIDNAMQQRDGFLRKVDLVNDTAEWWEPIKYNYQGYDVYTAAPPSNAFAAFTFLGLNEQFKDKQYQSGSANYLHLLAEIAKASYSSRLLYSVDPELDPFPGDSIFSAPYLAALASQLNLTEATEYQLPFTSPNSMNTTHFVIADSEGNLVSATQTLGNLFGSRIMPEGTGIWLNNSLAYCTYEPKGNPMDAKPGHHKLSGDCPVIIMKDNQPWAALGSPGGHTITQNVPQIIFNLLDFQMTMVDAIAAPKISFEEPNNLIVESTVPTVVQDSLRQMGHQVVNHNIGNAHGVQIIRDENGNIVRFEGAADPRGHGLAAGN